MLSQEKKKNMGLALVTLVAVVTVLVIIKAVLNLGSANFSAGPAGSKGIPTGEAAPDFTLKNLDGNEVRLADQRGSTVLLDFWATWCPPCRKELPHIQQFHDKYGDDGLVILAISSDSKKSDVRPFLEKNNYTFQVLFADGKVQKDYQVRGIPAVYMIDRDGMVRFHHVGYSSGGEKELERHIKELLEE